VVGYVHDSIHTRKVGLQISWAGTQQVNHFDPVHRLARLIVLASIDEPEVVACAEGWEQLARNVPGGTGQ
jgi:hypothetical protein